MESRIILKLWSEKNHEERLKVVNELYNYFQDGRSPHAFLYIDSLVIGLLRWRTTSSIQASVATLNVLKYIAFSMKMDYQLYVKATFEIAFKELGHKVREVRDTSRSLLVQLISNCTPEPQLYFDRIMKACLKHWELAWKEQCLDIISEMIQKNLSCQKVDIGKHTEEICVLLNDRNGRIRTKTMQVLVNISRNIDKRVFYTNALKYSISEIKLKRLHKRLQFLSTAHHISTNKDKARYDTSRYSSMQSLRYSSGIASSYPSTLASVACLSEAAGLNEVATTTSYARYKNGCNMGDKTNCSPTSDVFTTCTGNKRMQKSRKVSSMMERLGAPWNIQITSLKELQWHIHENQANLKEGNCSLHLENLEGHIILLLDDIHVRGQVIREVCSTVNCICEVFQQKASKFGAHIIPSLLQLIPNLSTTISNLAGTSLCIIAKNSFSSLTLAQFQKHGFTSKSYAIRRCCAHLLYFSLVHTDPSLLMKWLLLIEKLLAQALRDSDHMTRIFGRKAFWRYHNLFKATAGHFYKMLTWNEQKYLAIEKIYPTMLKFGATRRFPVLSRQSYVNPLHVLREMILMTGKGAIESVPQQHSKSDLTEYTLNADSISCIPKSFSKCSSDSFSISFSHQGHQCIATINSSSVENAAITRSESKNGTVSTTESGYFTQSLGKGQFLGPHKEQTRENSNSVQCKGINDFFYKPKGDIESLIREVPNNDIQLPLTEDKTAKAMNQASSSTHHESRKDVALQTIHITQDQSSQVSNKDESMGNEKVSPNTDKRELVKSQALSVAWDQNHFHSNGHICNKEFDCKNICSFDSNQKKYCLRLFNTIETFRIHPSGALVALNSSSSHLNKTYKTKIVTRRYCWHQQNFMYARCGRDKTHDQSNIIGPAQYIARIAPLPNFPIEVALRISSHIKKYPLGFTQPQDSLKLNRKFQQESSRSQRRGMFNQLYNKCHHKNTLLAFMNKSFHKSAFSPKKQAALTNQHCLSKLNKGSFPVEVAVKFMFNKADPVCQSDHQNMTGQQESKSQAQTPDGDIEVGCEGQSKPSEVNHHQINPPFTIISNEVSKLPSLSSKSVSSGHSLRSRWPHKVRLSTRNSMYQSSGSSIETSLPASTPPTSVLQMTPQDLQLHSSQDFLNLSFT